MKLEIWLEAMKITIAEFAEKIGKDKSLVHRYIYDDVKPKEDVMIKIFFETLGAVRADDFYGISNELLEEYLKKKKKSSKEVLHADSFK